MKRILILASLLSLVAGCSRDIPAFVQALPDGQLVVAHRGGAHIAPENTMAAFDLAAEPHIAAEVMELDVHTTADGELVVIHDKSVDRVTGEGNGCGIDQDTEHETFGTVKVHESTLAELQAYDAGYCFEDPDTGENTYRGTGVTIPPLAEVLEAHDEQLFIVEVKQQEPSLVEQLMDEIVDLDAMDRVCFSNFDAEGTSDIAEHAPDGACIAMSGEGIRCWASESIMPFGGGGCEAYDLGSVPHDNSGFDLKKERFVRNIQATGAPVFMWTINDQSLMEQVLDLDVDGVITDRPDILRETIEAR